MATDLKELSTAAQDNILSVMKMTQTSVLEAIKTMVDTVEKFTPDLPIPSLPGLDMLPSASDGIAMTFGFAEKLLENQKDFTTSLMAAFGSVPVKPVAKVKAS